MNTRILAALLCLLLPCSLAHASKSLRIATEGAFAPFNYIDEQGNPAGFDVEIARSLCQAMNSSCSITLRPWDELIPGLIRGEYDAVIACMAKTPERERLVDFTVHYLRSKSGFVGRASESIVPTPEALSGKVLATQENTTHAAFLQKRYAQSRIELYPTIAEAFEALARGKADLVLTALLVALEFLRSEEGRGFDYVGEALPHEEYPYAPAHIVVRKGDHQLRKQLDDAIQDIRINGSYDRINRKFFPFSVY